MVSKKIDSVYWSYIESFVENLEKLRTFRKIDSKTQFSSNFYKNFLHVSKFSTKLSIYDPYTRFIFITDQLFQGGGGLCYDYVISFFKRGVWALITLDYEGEGGGLKTAKNWLRNMWTIPYNNLPAGNQYWILPNVTNRLW